MAREKTVYEYRIYDIGPSSPFEILTGDHWRISDVLSGRLHFHNCLEIGFCRSDSGFIGLDGGVTVPFRAGDIFLIPRHVPHTTCSSRGTRSLWTYLYIDLEALSGLPVSAWASDIEGGGRSCLRVRIEELPRIHFLAETLLAECLKESISDEEEKVAFARMPEPAAGADLPEESMMIRAYATALLLELRRLESANADLPALPGSRSFALKPALNYIRDRYMEPCGIRELSALCHLSESHFRRLFLESLGEPPLQFVNRTRIRAACALLDTTDASVIEIAQAVGKSSISSFNRNFHDFTGLSPREYRRRKQGRMDSDRSVFAYKGWTAPEEIPGKKPAKVKI